MKQIKILVLACVFVLCTSVCVAQSATGACCGQKKECVAAKKCDKAIAKCAKKCDKAAAKCEKKCDKAAAKCAKKCDKAAAKCAKKCDGKHKCKADGKCAKKCDKK